MNALPDESRLGPEGLPYDTVAPFIGLTLSTLYLLETQPSVQQYTQAQPQAQRAIRAFSTAVAQAGSRVRDTAPHGNMFDQHIEMFTAEEFWMFDLAIDVIAMFAAAGGLDPDTHALVIDDLQKLDKNTRNPHWKSQVPTAGDGPAEFRQLRAHIPRHENQAPASEDLILESLISAQTLQEWLPAHARTPEGLVPDGLGYDAVASFLNLTLATLTVLGSALRSSSTPRPIRTPFARSAR